MRRRDLILRAFAPPVAFPSVIVDTDFGSDDVLAIAFLLSRRDVRVEAITVVNGLAHVQPGARNAARLVALADSPPPVYPGHEYPLQRTADFPAEWRRIGDELPGVVLPREGAVRREHAVDFLARRLSAASPPVRVLALGPLTNLAAALRRNPLAGRAIRELIIMGGAVNVPGNLGDGGYFQTANKTAEWNFFADPAAAREVFAAGLNITLVPLDATNQVPIDLQFLKEFTAAVRSPLGRIAAQVLESDRKYIEAGFFYAWDPLAATALVEPRVLKTARLALELHTRAPQEGRTEIRRAGVPNARVALSADADLFKRTFFSTFQPARPERGRPAEHPPNRK